MTTAPGLRVRRASLADVDSLAALRVASALLAAAEAEARGPVYERAGYLARTDEMELVLAASSSE